MNGPDIHREVLDILDDGVLAVSPGGRIETLEPPAERKPGLEAGKAAGRGFAGLIFLREGVDCFTQLAIDATTGDAGGGRRVVDLRRGGEAVDAIAVFGDMTEPRGLSGKRNPDRQGRRGRSTAASRTLTGISGSALRRSPPRCARFGRCGASVGCRRSACSLAPTTRDPVEIRAVLKPGETIPAPGV